MFLHLFFFLLLSELTNQTYHIIKILLKYNSLFKVWLGIVIGILFITILSVGVGFVISDWFSNISLILGSAICLLFYGLRSLFASSGTIEIKHMKLSILTIICAYIKSISKGSTLPILILFFLQQPTVSAHYLFLSSITLFCTHISTLWIGPWLVQSFSLYILNIFTSFVFLIFGSIQVFKIFSGTFLTYFIYSIALLLLSNLCFHISENLK